MINPDNEKHVDRLASSIDWSRRRMEPFRSVRLQALQQYMGAYYSTQGSNLRMPTNMLELAVNIYARQQAAKAPKVRVRPRSPEIGEMAKEYEILLNHVLGEMDFEAAIRLCVMDSIFGVGIMKVGITPRDLAEQSSWFADAGMPFAEPIDLDNWVQDMTCSRMEQMSYQGHRYRLPIEIIKESPLFNKEARESVPSQEVMDLNKNEDGSDRANVFTMEEGGFGSMGGSDALPEDVGELWDIWLPRENKQVTFGSDRNGILRGKPLRVIDWEGPEGGPYHMLWYNEMPSNSFPLAPVTQWLDLNEAYNRVMRKLIRQSERQKDIVGYAGTAEDDARRVLDGGDGEVVRVDDPNSMKDFKFGGIDQVNLAFSLQLKDMMSYLAGNLDVLGGLSAQSDTLGQDRILNESANQRINDMQSRVYSFTTKVIKALGWYVWNDPTIERTLDKTTNSGRTKSFVFKADDKEGDYQDYNFSIEPYSMQHKTPQARLNQYTQILQNVILPLIPSAQAAGQSVNIDAITKVLAAESDIEEIANIFNEAGTFELMSQTGPNQREITADKPPMTKRTYERVNRPAGTRQGKDRAMGQALLGKPPQPDEMASITRPNT